MYFALYIILSSVFVVSIIGFTLERGNNKKFLKTITKSLLSAINKRYFYGFVISAILVAVSFWRLTSIGSNNRIELFEPLDAIMTFISIPAFVVGFGGGNSLEMGIVILIEILIFALLFQYVVPKKFISKMDKLLLNL